MLTTLKKVIDKANKGGYAVPAFNINNLEIALSVKEAAEANKSPIVLQTSEGAIEYAGMEYLAAIARTVAITSRVPVVFHLDHGKNVALVELAIKSGFYTSVMIDASANPFKENVRITKKIVAMAHSRGISVEAELGAIAGIEDFVSVEERDAHLTNPEDAVKFVKLTGCDALAIAIGTAHGAFKFKGETVLDIARLKKIKMLTRMPLVLHGASGIKPELVGLLHEKCALLGDCDRLKGAHGVSDTMIRQAVRGGINKVNIDTDLRIAFTEGVRAALLSNGKVIDPREVLKPARDMMRQVAVEKIRLLGSKGKA